MTSSGVIVNRKLWTQLEGVWLESMHMAKLHKQYCPLLRYLHVTDSNSKRAFVAAFELRRTSSARIKCPGTVTDVKEGLILPYSLPAAFGPLQGCIALQDDGNT
jgi:hypothetical protein